LNYQTILSIKEFLILMNY